MSPKGLKKRMTLAFLRCVNLDTQNSGRGLLKAKRNLFIGRYHGYCH